MISDLSKPYITYCQVERFHAPETLVKTRDCLRSWILPCLGHIEPEQLTVANVSGMREAMFKKGASSARQYSILCVLKGMLRFAREVLKLAALNPNEIQLPNRGTPHVTVLTKEELRQILASIDTASFSGARLRALIEVLLATGMRISEALSLDRRPFAAEVEHLEIVGKGKRRREVFFTPRCQYWVENFLNKRHDDHPALFVTTGYPARRLARDDISRFFVNLREKAGIVKKFTPHILRHTYCTNLLNNGADIMFIKELAGHQNIQTTARYYLSVSKQQLQSVVARHLDYGLEDDRALDG